MQQTDMTLEQHRQHQAALVSLLAEFDRVCKVLDIPYTLFAGTLLGAVRHQGFIPWDDDLDVMMLREDYQRFLTEASAVLDTERFYLQGEFSEHWPLFFSKLRLNGTTCLEKYHPKDPKIHQGIYIDLFPCDNAAATAPGRWLQFLAAKVVIAKALDRRGYETNNPIKKMYIYACRLLPQKPFWRWAVRGKADSPMVHSFFAAARSYGKNVFPRGYFAQRCDGQFEDGVYPIPVQYDALLTALYGDYMTLPPPEQRLCKQHALLVDTRRSYEAYQDYREGMTFDTYTRSIR